MARETHARQLPLQSVTLAAMAAVVCSGLVLIALDSDLAQVLFGAAAVVGLVALSAAVARDLLHRKAGVDVIALLALVGALALGEYLAGAVVSLMLASGRALEEYANARSRRELTALLERTPRIVNRYDGMSVESVSPEEVRIGDLLLVKPGEVVPVDGIVTSASAVLDESSLTGEAVPVCHELGDAISSGVVNAGAPFDMRAATTTAESAYAGIIRLVEEGQRSKAPFVRLADRYALVFVPLTLALAGIAWVASGEAVRALAVLVVATPCPLILAAPIAIISGVSRAANRGVIIKGGGALERLVQARVLLFDKTGTLTMGRPVLSDVAASGTYSANEVLRLAASVEQMSPHVLAGAVARAARERGSDLAVPSNVVEEMGLGIRGTVEGHELRVGRLEWVTSGEPPDWVHRFKRRLAFDGFANTFVAIDGELAGALVLEDPIRPDASRTLRSLRRAGIERIVMVTGDRASVAESVAAIVGADAVVAERTPPEKVDAVRNERVNGVTVMVGDGINDAPALATADVGVAMGARGATASSEAADVVLLVDRLDKLTEALQISQRARGIAVQSVLGGMGLAFIGMAAAAGGLLPPVGGALLQEGIDVAAILNSLRALGGYRTIRPEEGPVAALAERLRSEHRDLLPLLDELRLAADRLDLLPEDEALLELTRIHDYLTNRLLPHEDAEEKTFYPKVAALLGGEDPTGTMSRAHVEIAHLVRLLGGLLEDIGSRAPDEAELADFRRVLYGLHAILRLHFAQEEEAYLSLPST